MPFIFEKMTIPEVISVTASFFSDPRGFFSETYKYSEFARSGITEHFLQDNHSGSSGGVLRGLHFQKKERQQSKLVRCIKGKIFDVAVDIRRGSPTYAKWVALELSEENKKMIYIPAGFAHGFLVLSDYAEVVYKTGAEYSPEHDSGIFWNDPEIGIDWPLRTPLLSEKDKRLPLLSDCETSFIY